jgi:hypothetical protein
MTAIELSEFQGLRGWLNSERSYTRGLILLSVSKCDKNILDSLRMYKNDKLLLDTIMLRYSTLKNIYQAVEVVDEDVPVLPVSQPTIVLEPVSSTKNKLVAKKQQLETELKDFFRKRGVWHTKLAEFAYHKDNTPKTVLTDDEKKNAFYICEDLIELQKNIEKNFVLLDHYALYGHFPETAYKRVIKPKKLDNSEAFLKLKNSIAPRHSKHKKKIAEAKAVLDTLSPKIKTKTLKKLAKWEEEFEFLNEEKKRLEKQINGTK